MSSPATAHGGGKIRLLKVPAGSYEVTVSSAPTPLRTGIVDITVLAEGAGGGNAGPLTAVVIAYPSDEPTREISVPAMLGETLLGERALADHIPVDGAGLWVFRIDIRGSMGRVSAQFEAEISDTAVIGSPMVMILVVAIPAIVILLVRARRRCAQDGA